MKAIYKRTHPLTPYPYQSYIFACAHTVLLSSPLINSNMGNYCASGCWHAGHMHTSHTVALCKSHFAHLPTDGAFCSKLKTCVDGLVHKLRHAWRGPFRQKLTSPHSAHPTPTFTSPFRYAGLFSDLAASRCFLPNLSVFYPRITLFCSLATCFAPESLSILPLPGLRHAWKFLRYSPPSPVTRDIIYERALIHNHNLNNNSTPRKKIFTTHRHGG